MIYKLGNVKDVGFISGLTDAVREVLVQYTQTLTDLYGEDRDIDNDDGGFVLFVQNGTDFNEVKAMFDYSEYAPENVTIDDGIVSAIYLLNNEFVVIIVMAVEDTPYEILVEVENEKI